MALFDRSYNSLVLPMPLSCTNYQDVSICILTGSFNDLNQQQQLFYGPLIQNNQGEPVPETIGHINPHYHHYPPQYL